MKTRSGSQNLDGASSSSHQHDQPHQIQTRQRGNLGKALNYYDLANGKIPKQQHDEDDDRAREESCHQQEHPHLMIQIPTAAGSRTSTKNNQQPTPIDDHRNRAPTFGSEFDMSWAKERGMSISCLLTPMGEDDAHYLPSTVTSGLYKDDMNATVSTSSSSNTAPLNNVTFQPMPSMNEEGGDMNQNAESDEFFHNNDDDDNDDDDREQKKLFSHTPPSNVATSYEQRHFQKRMRAGVSVIYIELCPDELYCVRPISLMHNIIYIP
jgi:hypothetical protein